MSKRNPAPPESIANEPDERAEAQDPAKAHGEGTDLLELVLADAEASRRVAPTQIEGVVVGVLAGFSASGEILVEHPDGEEPLVARAVVKVTSSEVGREVALMFEGADPRKPIVMGLMHVAMDPPAAEETPEPEASAPSVEVTRDGERLELTAKDQIVLRCGKASITLTRAGKIIIRGAHLVTRSSGVNRIQGGTVRIN